MNPIHNVHDLIRPYIVESYGETDVKALLPTSVIARFLEASKGNRAESRDSISHLCRMMQDGKYIYSRLEPGAAFDTRGYLRNFHHRGKAAIRYGQPILVRVTWNLSEEELIHMDKGVVRTTAHQLTLNRGENPALASYKTSIVRSLINITKNSNTKIEVEQVDYVHGVCGVGIDFMLKLLKEKRISARQVSPVVAAPLAYAYEIDNAKIEDLAIQYATRNCQSGSACDAMLKLHVNNREGKRSRLSAIEEAVAMCVGVMAHVNNESRILLRARTTTKADGNKMNTTGWDWVTARRIEMGLPTLNSLFL